MLPTLTVADWENLRRELIWIRRARVIERHRDLPYVPKGVVAAWRMVGGCAEFALPGGRVNVPAGQWIFPGNVRGQRTFSRDAEFISIRFRIRWPGGQDLLPHDTPLVSRGAAGRRLDDAGFSLAGHVQDRLSPEGQLLPQARADFSEYLELRNLFDRWLEAYLLFMTGHGQKAILPREMDDRITESVRVMETQVRRGENLREQDLARQAGLSLSHFKRLFACDVQLTPKEWLTRKRLEIAGDRLRETDTPVKRIGYDLGFRSPNHFSAWFRKHTGKTPGRHRAASTGAF